MATQTVTVKEARNRFAELIERASIAGDTFVVTKFGKTKAVIAPPSRLNEKAANNDNRMKAREEFLKRTFGMWRDRKDMEDTTAWVEKQRAPRYGKIFD